eukprot:jgi/Picsp_1/3812/NSC_01324-R1_carotenoid cleavage dioxygenase 8
MPVWCLQNPRERTGILVDRSRWRQTLRGARLGSRVGHDGRGTPLAKGTNGGVRIIHGEVSEVYEKNGSSWPSKEARGTAFGNTDVSVGPMNSSKNEAAVVDGTLPSWLCGSYYRNGPGWYDNGTEEGMLHMFDGYGLLTKIELRGKDNSASIRVAFVESEAYQAYKKTGKMKWREFGTPVPTRNAGEKIVDVLRMALGSAGVVQGVTDNSSVNVLHRRGDTNASPRNDKNDVLWAMTETVAGTYAVDSETLETLERVEFQDEEGVTGTLTTAHPHMLSNGDIINIVSAPGVGFTVYRTRAQSSNVKPKREFVATVPHRRPASPAWIHDFPGTDTHVIIPETPLYFNLGALMLGNTGSHVFLDWVPLDGTLLHIVDLETGSVDTVETDPFFVFHWVNAFHSDEDTFLTVDAAVYKDPSIVTHLLLDSVRADYSEDASAQLPESHFRRLTLKKEENGKYAVHTAEDGSCWSKLSDSEQDDFGNFAEFPSIESSKRGKEYRYFWGSAAVRPTNVSNALVKFDTEKKESILWHEAGSMPGEPCFIPNPSATSEDDGAVISLVTEASGSSALVVLDAKTMQELARVRCPRPLTSGFHGTFIPSL